MVDLMMWLVIAALLLAAALQGIGFYQKGAYIYQMKNDLQGVASLAMTKASYNGTLDDSAVASAVDTSNKSDGVTITWSLLDSTYTAPAGMVTASATTGGTAKSYILKATHARVPDIDAYYFFNDIGGSSSGTITGPKGAIDASSGGSGWGGTGGGTVVAPPKTLLWTDKIVGNATWYGYASSADGQTLMASKSSPDRLYRSLDGGFTWSAINGMPVASYYGIAMSADGSKMAAGITNGGFYLSSDGGTTWTQQTAMGNGTWYSVAMSADGNTVITAAYNTNIKITKNFGSTWSNATGTAADIGTTGIGTWYAVTASADGSHLAVGKGDGGAASYIYTSSDGGTTWTTRTGAGVGKFYSIASSSDGMKLVTGKRDDAGAGTNIYTSSDGGATWTIQSGSPKQSWTSFASSSDGKYLAAGSFSGGVYASNDSGVTWTEQTSIGTGPFYGIASSSNGQRLLTGKGGGHLYTAIYQ